MGIQKQDMSEPDIFGGLVYKFRNIVTRDDLSDQFSGRVKIQLHVSKALKIHCICTL